MNDPKQNHFVKFHHEEDRIAALEADLKSLSYGIYAYLNGGPATQLAEALRKIIASRDIPDNAEK